MKTASVKLGGKNYQAAPLTVAETVLVSRTLAEMGQATAQDDFEGVTATLEAMRRILFTALQKANSQITAEELKAAAPGDVMMALGKLFTASRQNDGRSDAAAD